MGLHDLVVLSACVVIFASLNELESGALYLRPALFGEEALKLFSNIAHSVE